MEDPERRAVEELLRAVPNGWHASGLLPAEKASTSSLGASTSAASDSNRANKSDAAARYSGRGSGGGGGGLHKDKRLVKVQQNLDLSDEQLEQVLGECGSALLGRAPKISATDLVTLLYGGSVGDPAEVRLALADVGADVDDDDDNDDDDQYSLGLSHRRSDPHRGSVQAAQLDSDPEHGAHGAATSSSVEVNGSSALRESLLQEEAERAKAESLGRCGKICEAIASTVVVVARVVFCCSGTHVAVVRSWPRTIKMMRWISKLTKLDWTARVVLPVLFLSYVQWKFSETPAPGAGWAVS